MRSANDETAYPPPSCSAFHGRSGSSEWAVTTCGHAVQQTGEVAAEVGVPGVGVHQVGALAAGGDREVDPEGLQGGVGGRRAPAGRRTP